MLVIVIGVTGCRGPSSVNPGVEIALCVKGDLPGVPLNRILTILRRCEGNHV